jgi:hypothetical protein
VRFSKLMKELTNCPVHSSEVPTELMNKLMVQFMNLFSISTHYN